MDKALGALRALVIAISTVGLFAWGAAPASAAPIGAGLAEFPIQCLDGSTVEFGQLCPLPSLRCADGSALPLGGSCPPPAESRTPRSTTCPDGTVVRTGQACPTTMPTPAADPQPAQDSPEMAKCKEAGICQ